MNKNYFKALLFILSIFALIGCGNEQEPAHSHEFASEWSYNETTHYHLCKDDTCAEVSESAAHTFGDWTEVLAPTCESSGAKERVCSVCKYKEQANVPALGHSYSEWEVKTPATRENDEVQHRICSVCENEEEKVIENSKLIFYTVKFVDENGTVLQELEVQQGHVPTFDEALPTKDSTLVYSYEFAGWDSEVVAATEDKVYIAVYTESYIKYTVTFKDADGTQLSTKGNYHYGDTVLVPSVPAKVTADKFYSFANWDQEVVTVVGDATYIAVYNEIDRTENGQLVWTDTTVRDSLLASDFFNAEHPADLSVVTIDGKNSVQVKYEEGFFALDGTVKTTPGIKFANSNNLKLSEGSTVTFYVRASEEWSLANNHAGIYIFYDGQVCGVISAKGKLWNGATASGERERHINQSIIPVMNVFANATVGDKQWVEVTITFNGIDNPDLSNLSIAYGCTEMVSCHGLLNTITEHSNSWIYVSDLTVVTHHKSNDYTTNAEGHWYTCTDAGCDLTFDYGTHEYGDWSTKTPAEGTTNEVKHRFCKVCNYEEIKVVVETFEIKFANYDGTVLESVQVDRGQIPEYTLAVPTKAANEDYIYLFNGWDSELTIATEAKTYTAVFTEVAKTDNGILVWDETSVNYSVVAKDFYAGLHPADLSVVTIAGKNALQIKYEEGFFDLTGTVKTTPGIQFANSNKFKLAQNSTVTFYVRANEEWNCSDNKAGIFIFYDGEVYGVIGTNGKLWSAATATGERDRLIGKSSKTVVNIFANGTISDKQWVEVTITFDGVETPDLSKLSIAYGTNEGSDFHGLLNIDNAKGQSNSWIYVSDLTVVTHHSSSNYLHDENGHWHTCTVEGCDAILDYETHKFGDWSTKTPATNDADEVQSRTCSVCSREETRTVTPTFDINFVDHDGTVLQTVTVKKGEVPQFTLDEPTREADLTYTYEFAGWDSELEAAYEIKTYKAVYAEVYINYTVVFKDADGTELSSKGDYHYGDTVEMPNVSGKVSGDKFVAFVGWDKEVVEVDADAVYQAVYKETERVSNGQLVWDTDVINNSVVASDFYAGLHPADLSVVEVSGKNALQIKYEYGFYNLSGTVKTTPGIQFTNSNIFKLTQDSVVKFYVRTSDEWSASDNNGGIYIFYNGEVYGTISVSGKLWDSATAAGERNRFINKVDTTVMNIFANSTIGDKNWVEVTISFDGIQNPDLSKLSIAYGIAKGSDYSGLLNTQVAHSNSWIYISDLTVTTNESIRWTDSNVSEYVTASDFYAGLHPADLSVVTVDGRNALQVKYEEGFFDLTGTVKTTPGVQFVSNENVKLTQDSVVKFYVRASDEWTTLHNRAGIYIFYDGETNGVISANGSLWSGATAAKEKDDVLIRKTYVNVMQVFANGDKNACGWVEVTITFNGIDNPDLSKLSVAYGCAQGSDYNGLLNSQTAHSNSWFYISDITIS